MKDINFIPKNEMRLDQLKSNFQGDEIRCLHCNKRHFPDEKTFITFYGNVTVGLEGGLVGNNFMENGRLGRISFVCRNRKCLTEILMVDE